MKPQEARTPSLRMVPECALFAKSFGCRLQGFAVDSSLFVYAAIPGALPERRKENPSLSVLSEEVLPPLSTCGCCIVLPWAALRSG